MPFQKGHSGNPSGKPKGTPNKTTKLEREFLQILLDEQTIKIKTELSLLHGEGYLKIILSLLDYILPKLQRIELNTEHDNEKDEDNFIILSNGEKIPFW